jgi:uncharacterized protein with PQ loop repeat
MLDRLVDTVSSMEVTMDTERLAVLAGIISTTIFAMSHIPMLIRAFRTKDLRSYSATNLVLSNLGNGFHWLYVASLPFGPIWFLHGFYTLAAAIMLVWYVQYRSRWSVVMLRSAQTDQRIPQQSNLEQGSS